MSKWETLVETPGCWFDEFHATVSWAGIGFMVVHVRDSTGGGFTSKSAMDYMVKEYPDADEIKIRAKQRVFNPHAPGRYPIYVEGSSNPWL